MSIESRVLEVPLVVDGKWTNCRVEIVIDFRKVAEISGRDALKTKKQRVTLCDRAIIVDVEIAKLKQTCEGCEKGWPLTLETGAHQQPNSSTPVPCLTVHRP